MNEDDLPPELLSIIEHGQRRAKKAEVMVALPPELEKTRRYAQRAIAPLKPANEHTIADKNFLFDAERTDAGQELPPYYLIYFLLVDLLGFKNIGRFEKIAWSVPIDFEGEAYLIEHRKFGLGLFARKDQEENARKIVKLVKTGVKVAQPFFKWMAAEAVRASKFNIVNNAQPLFGRYHFMRNLYISTLSNYDIVRSEYSRDRKQREFPFWRRSSKIDSTASPIELIAHYRLDWDRLSEEVSWLALGTIDAFFSWTEHIFIHLAVLQGKVTTGEEIARLIGAEWNVKYKYALDISDKEGKTQLDKLIAIRQQLRNFVAHGAFGKEGEAFHFHSRAGAVPVTLTSTGVKNKFSLNERMGFNDSEALKTIESFIVYLWSGIREPARIYIQDSGLPLYLTMATDGRYAAAIKSIDAMSELTDHLGNMQDAHANMDW